jgi:hypothetical protein
VRRFWPLIAVPAGALAVLFLAGLLRREATSATPGEVVEDFLGHVVRDRFEKAAPLLAESGEGAPATLSRWKENVEAGLGSIHRVRGETDWISGEQAEATGVLVAERRERRLRFALEREEGRWRIAQLDDFWGDDAPAPAFGPVSIREDGRARPRRARTR